MKQETIKAGDIVKYYTPLSEAEVNARFIVIENRGDRLLVEFICNNYLRPQSCFSISYFELA